MVTIAKNYHETPSTMTLRLDAAIEAVPGQFLMVWVPGIDEFPMSLSYTGTGAGITYQVLGEGTQALAAKKRGEVIGIRGPYGRGFELKGKKLLAVGGGLGMAPLAPFVEHAAKRKAKVTAVMGARTARELLFVSRVKKTGAKAEVCTDDGTAGHEGLATELAERVMGASSFDSVYACGPERMIVGVLRLTQRARVPMQASLERIMKCGIGVCDSCALDGRHVCRDGPVFGERELRAFDDLGKTRLDLCGRKTPI